MKKFVVSVIVFLVTCTIAYYSSLSYFNGLTKGLEGCPLEKKPVCAYDDYTYINECFMKKAGTTKRYDGECSLERDLLYSTSSADVEIANPASVNCVDKGGTLEIRNEEGGQVGYCNLPGGVVCEEWALFRGECDSVSSTTDPCLLSDEASREKCKLKE